MKFKACTHTVPDSSIHLWRLHSHSELKSSDHRATWITQQSTCIKRCHETVQSQEENECYGYWTIQGISKHTGSTTSLLISWPGMAMTCSNFTSLTHVMAVWFCFFLSIVDVMMSCLHSACSSSSLPCQVSVWEWPSLLQSLFHRLHSTTEFSAVKWLSITWNETLSLKVNASNEARQQMPTVPYVVVSAVV